ncbi:IS66-like element accessory protein TnpA [Zeimonas arvi]|uniref:Transposase n=1 Tax=Zeimonas arvi TaxID=2498847 RepID=A0A5C8NK60_9BURK|nr:transposase [Zeimonas arvi]TXL61658.1 transposase [Zeimonas arvi]
MASTYMQVDTKLEHHEKDLAAGVARIDASGRRWYTAQFKREVVAQCLRPGASVSRISIEHGLNTNLVRKWVAREQRESGAQVALLPVTIDQASSASPSAAEGASIEIRVGRAVIAIGASAPAAQIEAIVRALR